MTPLRASLYVLGAVLGVAFIALLMWNWDPFGRLKRAKAVATVSQAAQKQAEVTTKALDTHTTQTIVIRERADRAVQIVKQAAGADTPVPPDVLDAWRRGLQYGAPAAGAADPSEPPR